jgi:transposase
LRRLGWRTKRIARELGLARNTVREWLRSGADRTYAVPAKGALLAEHLAWIRERFRAGVRNGDVIRQELLARGVVASLRTVNRALGPLRRELVLADRATIRFETPPGRQMQVDFGEKWLEIEGIQQKRYVFVVTLGFTRRTFAMVFGSMRQRDWIMGIEGACRKDTVIEWACPNPVRAVPRPGRGDVGGKLPPLPHRGSQLQATNSLVPPGIP